MRYLRPVPQQENIRQQVIMDAINVIIADLDPTQVIDDIKAKSLAAAIKTKVESSHDIMFDEDKFLHALATNSTFVGAIGTVSELLPPRSREPTLRGQNADHHPTDVDNKGSKGDNIYDMFYFPNNDARQVGSVHAARAIANGTFPSLAQRVTHRVSKHDTIDNHSEDFHDTSSTSGEETAIPKQYKNRLREQLHQFRMMSFPYFKESKRGRCLFGTLVILTLVNSGINVYFSYLIRDFWTALSDKQVQTFYHIMLKFVISMLALIPLQVSFRFIRVQLGIAWRKWLTERVLKLYFSNKVRLFYISSHFLNGILS